MSNSVATETLEGVTSEVSSIACTRRETSTLLAAVIVAKTSGRHVQWTGGWGGTFFITWGTTGTLSKADNSSKLPKVFLCNFSLHVFASWCTAELTSS